MFPFDTPVRSTENEREINFRSACGRSSAGKAHALSRDSNQITKRVLLPSCNTFHMRIAYYDRLARGVCVYVRGRDLLSRRCDNQLTGPNREINLRRCL